MSSLLSAEQDQAHNVLVQQVTELNKNKFYYYFCFNVNDYVFQRKDAKTLQVLVVPKIVCMKTYIPNYKLYSDLLRVVNCKPHLLQTPS